MASEEKMGREARPGAEAEGEFRLPRPSRRLAALTSGALALPGIAGSASADAPIERAEASGSFSYYREDKLSPNKFQSGQGSRDRYEVYTGQLRFDLPVSQRVDLGVQMLYEHMSGASPWYVVAGTSGQLLQVMSGATIEDERFDITVDTDFYLDNGKDTFSGGISTEKDYFSLHAGLGSDRNYNDKNTTLSISGAFSYDWIDPTDADKFSSTRPTSGERWSIDLFTGLSQILTRSTVGQITVNYKHSDGYLGDPYKAVANIDPLVGLASDVRPGTKDQVSVMARLRQRVDPLNASIHADYRFYADSFGITSHTVDLAWHQSIFETITVVPGLRYYSQSKADFYDPILPAGILPKHRSSDFRLSPYGAVSMRLKLEMELNELWQYDAPQWLRAIGFTDSFDLIGALSYERYLSDGDYALVSVSESEEAPGLVKFQVFAATLTGRF